MVLLVTYDLKRPGQDYAKLYEAIKSSGAWWHYLESTWLVDTSQTPKQVAEKLFPHIDQNDRLFVVKIDRNYFGWLPKDAWEWIEKRQF